MQAKKGPPEATIKLLPARPRAPGPGELGLELLAAPIHPIDLLRARGLYPLALPLPGIGGSEGIARVIHLGPKVPPCWNLGDLCLLPPRFGSYRSHATLPASQAIALPPQIDPIQASMLIINPLSADLLLDRCEQLGHDSFVNLPASGAVGQCLLALGKVRGFKSINLIRSQRWKSWLKGIDPSATIEHLDTWIQSDQAAGGPSIAFDGVGGHLARAVAQKLSQPGSLHVYGAASRQAPQIGLSELIFDGLTTRGFWLHRWMRSQSQELINQRIASLATLMIKGQLSVKVAQTYPLKDYREAFLAARDPQTFGKVILLPNPNT